MKLLWNLSYWLTIKPRINKLKKLLPEAIIHPTGSRYICNPPVFGTDIDFLVYVDGTALEGLEATLVAAGYTKTPFVQYCGSTINANEFNAWRRRSINLIVSTSLPFAEGFQTATHICRINNFREKYERAMVHEILRGNRSWEDNNGYAGYGKSEALLVFLNSFNGPHGHMLHKAYRAQQNLEFFQP